MAEENRMNLWISILHRYRKSYVARRLERCGSAGSLPLMLLALSVSDGARQEQLAERLRVDKASVARSIQKLEGEGYLLREGDSEDKRANRVFLTRKARDLLPQIRAAITDWNEQALSGIPDDERAVLMKCLRVMAENVCGGEPQETETLSAPVQDPKGEVLSSSGHPE